VSGPSFQDRRTLAAGLLLVTLVGTNLVAIRYSNRELDPFWNAGFRFVLAAILFVVLGAWRGVPRPGGRALLGAVLYGLLAFAGFFGFLYAGMVHVTAALGQTILALGPLITLFLAAAVGLERLAWRPVLGAGLSVAGIAVAFGAQSQLGVPPLAVLSVGVAATSFAAGAIVAKRMPPADPFVQNAVGTAVGGVLLLAISALAGERWVVPASPGTWLAFVYLVVPGTVVIFLLFLFLTRKWSASAVSYQFILAPLVSVTLGAVLLEEPVGAGVIAGVGLVVAGVWIGALARE
jgi:drug/metabolite transporter (DMT)-like permease